MKFSCKNLFLAAAASLLATTTTYAIDKAGAGSELTLGASWTGGTAPTNIDDATWTTGSLMGAQTVGSAVNWRIINVTATAPASTPLSLSGSAITLSGASLNGSLTVVSNNSTTSSLTIANDLLLTGVNNDTATTIGEGGTGRLQLSSEVGGLTLGNVTSNGGGLANDANLWLRSSATGSGTINGTLTVDGQLAKGDTGTWTLNGANTIGWVYTNNGTLLAGHNQAFGVGTIYINDNNNNSSPVFASKDAAARSYTNSLDLTGGFGGAQSAVFGQTTGGTGTQSFGGGVNLGTAVRRITTNSATTFSNTVTGTGGGITKLGTSTLTLSGTNNYTGATTVNAGTLLVNGNNTAATGALASLANTTVGGTGIIGAATATINGTLQGGAGAVGQSLTLLGAVTLADNSTVLLTLGAGGTHSSIAFNGTETFDGNQAFTFLDAGVITGTTFQDILTGVTLDPGTTASWIINNAGWTGTFTWDGANIDLLVTAVPEPGAALLGGLGMLALLRRRRA